MLSKINKISIIFILLIVLGSSLSACKPKEPELDIQAQKTGFAQTAIAQASMTAEFLPTATETPTPLPTSTPTRPATSTPISPPTKSGNTEQPPTTGNDAATWLANDPPDNSKFAPGEAFTVTWTIENTGTSTWTEKFYIQFASGEQMEAPQKVFLPYPVPPSKNVQISVNFVAPQSLGQKRTDWKLFNASDQSFYDFYLVIDIVSN